MEACGDLIQCPACANWVKPREIRGVCSACQPKPETKAHVEDDPEGEVWGDPDGFSEPEERDGDDERADYNAKHGTDY